MIRTAGCQSSVGPQRYRDGSFPATKKSRKKRLSGGAQAGHAA
jgi:hypothetical protein